MSAEHDAAWAEVAAVEREIRFCAYASAGDSQLREDSRMFAIWAGRLQLALKGRKFEEDIQGGI